MPSHYIVTNAGPPVGGVKNEYGLNSCNDIIVAASGVELNTQHKRHSTGPGLFKLEVFCPVFLFFSSFKCTSWTFFFHIWIILAVFLCSGLCFLCPLVHLREEQLWLSMWCQRHRLWVRSFLCRFGFKVLCGELPFKHSGSEVSREMLNSFKFSLCGWEPDVMLKSDAVCSIGDLGCGGLEV